MAQYCVAFGCKEKSEKGASVSFHRLPKDSEMRKKWIAATKMVDSNPGIHTVICSAHFTPEDFYPRLASGFRKLRENAVPSLVNTYPTRKKSRIENKKAINTNKGHNAILNKRGTQNDGAVSDKNTLKTTPSRPAKRPRKSRVIPMMYDTRISPEPEDEYEKGKRHIDEYNCEDETPETFDSQIRLEEEEEEYEKGIGYNSEDDNNEEMVIVVVPNDESNAFTNNDDDDNEYDGDEVPLDNLGDDDEEFTFVDSLLSSEVQQARTISTEVVKEHSVQEKIVNKKNLVLKNFCRLCLSKRREMLPLFETSLRFVKASLEVVIELCTGIQVKEEDASDRICKMCISRLESLWAFRQQCLKSDKLLKAMQNTNQSNEVILPDILEFEDTEQNQGADDTVCNNQAQFVPCALDEPNERRRVDEVPINMRFLCSNCDETFSTENALSVHVNNVHRDLNPFIQDAVSEISCSICGEWVHKRKLHNHYLEHKIVARTKDKEKDGGGKEKEGVGKEKKVGGIEKHGGEQGKQGVGKEEQGVGKDKNVGGKEKEVNEKGGEPLSLIELLNKGLVLNRIL